MFFVFALLLALQTWAHASSSFYLEDIQPLLQQQPTLWAYLQNTLDIQNVGIAPRINSKENPALGGSRIAPYVLSAKPKGTPGDYTLTIEVRAETIFLDAHGKKVPLKDGATIKEHLTGVLVRTIKPDEK